MAAAYSPKRAIVHVAIAIAVVFAAAGTLIGVGVVIDTEAFFEGLAQFTVFVALLVYTISYLLQSGRRRTALGIGGSVVVIVALALAFVTTSPPVPAPTITPLTSADRAPLVADGDRLRHPTLGFSIKQPGPGFHEATHYAAMANSNAGSGSLYYAYADAGSDARPNAVLMVGIATGGDLTAVLAGVELSLSNTATQQHAPLIPIARAVGSDEAQLHVTLGGAHFRIHLYAREPANHSPIYVSLTVMSRDEHALDDVLSSLR
jgi:hypothetical protein